MISRKVVQVFVLMNFGLVAACNTTNSRLSQGGEQSTNPCGNNDTTSEEFWKLRVSNLKERLHCFNHHKTYAQRCLERILLGASVKYEGFFGIDYVGSRKEAQLLCPDTRSGVTIADGILKAGGEKVESYPPTIESEGNLPKFVYPTTIFQVYALLIHQGSGIEWDIASSAEQPTESFCTSQDPTVVEYTRYSRLKERELWEESTKAFEGIGPIYTSYDSGLISFIRQPAGNSAYDYFLANFSQYMNDALTCASAMQSKNYESSK